MRKSAKIWLVIAILLCACVTVLNFTEGRIPSVILALAEIAALGYPARQGEEGRLLAAVRLLPAVLPHRRHRRHHRRAPASCSRWVLRQSARY